MSRFIPCYLPEREVFHVDPNAEDDEDEWLEALGTQLKLLLQNAPKGHVKMSEPGVEWFVPWYMENERKVVLDVRLEPHRNRAPANALRVALLLAVSNGEKSISKGRITQAVRILNWIAPTMWAMYGFTDEMSSGVSRGEKIVVATLAKGTESTLLHCELTKGCMNRLGGLKEMKEVVWGLVEKGIVEPIYKTGQVPSGWPPRGWRLRKVEGVKE